jgi:hypothetical protein
MCQLTNKNVIAQFGMVLCYFLFFHLTGQALSPLGSGRSKCVLGYSGILCYYYWSSIYHHLTGNGASSGVWLMTRKKVLPVGSG